MIYHFADRISYLREKHQMTQSTLAKKLGISRSAINAWEMSLSAPSCKNIVEMAKIFHVSTDYLFGISDSITVNITNLDNEERELVFRLVECLSKEHRS